MKQEKEKPVVGQSFEMAFAIRIWEDRMKKEGADSLNNERYWATGVALNESLLKDVFCNDQARARVAMKKLLTLSLRGQINRDSSSSASQAFHQALEAPLIKAFDKSIDRRLKHLRKMRDVAYELAELGNRAPADVVLDDEIYKTLVQKSWPITEYAELHLEEVAILTPEILARIAIGASVAAGDLPESTSEEEIEFFLKTSGILKIAKNLMDENKIEMVKTIVEEMTEYWGRDFMSLLPIHLQLQLLNPGLQEVSV